MVTLLLFQKSMATTEQGNEGWEYMHVIAGIVVPSNKRRVHWRLVATASAPASLV